MSSQCIADYEVSYGTTKATRLLAPMPGVVTICEKQIGDAVCEGDVVLILEAMKMENLVTAPVSGKLVSSCSEGERVTKGTVLAQIA